MRQGSGGTYFINIQQVIEKFNINKTKLLLKFDLDLSTLANQEKHLCDKCSYALSEEQCNILDNLPQLEDALTYEVKSSLVYISGYVTRNDIASVEDTFVYFERYGMFTAGLDRGGLHIPSDSICEWVCFCYIMFHSVVTNICRYSLSKIFMNIAERFNIAVEMKHGNILSNILLNNYCRLNSPASSSEPKLKVLKLAN